MLNYKKLVTAPLAEFSLMLSNFMTARIGMFSLAWRTGRVLALAFYVRRQYKKAEAKAVAEANAEEKTPAVETTPRKEAVETDVAATPSAGERREDVAADVAARRELRAARRRGMDERVSLRASVGNIGGKAAEGSPELRAALRSQDVEQMVRAFAAHKDSAEPKDRPLLAKLQQRIEQAAAHSAEEKQRREARRAERKARLDQLRQDMIMRTPKQPPRPAADLIRKPKPKVKAAAGGGTPVAARSPGRTAAKTNPDEAFLERFDVKGSLGEGGFGEVLACWDNKRQRRVAVKVVRAEGSAREGETAKLSEDETRRLMREATAARRVKHPNCMQCYGFYIAQDRSKFFLLLEFLAGRSLEDILLTRGPMAVNNPNPTADLRVRMTGSLC